ncbi:MAG: AI-2E family transporter [Methylococcales symbiont of Hymedesmia sp. n. MRB-2018]|nr:MAG: AI-2E family transporter [Methylococcales symbiont of Hymedesmia sp. n. MRB-2018]KAF3983208.1 MAG: AI-2E family transporter [Methylococcales symbiont of Hymedesmia sp. n. MRB-2018]
MNTEADFSNFRYFKDRIRRILPNSQAVALALILIIGFILIYSLSDILMPVFASIVLTYLLLGIVEKLEKKLPRIAAVYIVFSGFLTCLGLFLFVLMPMISTQTVQLVQKIPEMIKRAQAEIMRLPELHPQFITENSIIEIMASIQNELIHYGQDLISNSASSFAGLVAAIVYLFLVPMMVFFFLKDKNTLITWFVKFLPRDRSLTIQVWKEVDIQIANYVRGKFAEVIILTSASYITYTFLDLNYAMLLSVLMGLSVVIPYIGATLVTFPVLGVAIMQWGFTADEFMYVAIAYSIIQAIDGVILIPLLFSEAVNLHPVAIIIAILFFGGLWGFWGVFFAIPLATAVKAILNAWPPTLVETPLDTSF